jgi:Tfp pilus assembly major pilin PilA
MNSLNNMTVARHAQQGMTTIGLLLVLGIIGLIALTAIRVIPIYIENYTIKSVLTSVKNDQKVDPKSKAAIWNSLKKRLYINEVRMIKREHVEITRGNGQTTVVITYESRRPYLGPLFIGGSFSESVVIER